MIIGVYQIYIEDSPKTDFPVFFTTVNGVSQPSLLRKTTIWTTSIEIEYAYSKGYT